MVVKLVEESVLGLYSNGPLVDKSVGHIVGCHSVKKKFVMSFILLIRLDFRTDVKPKSIADQGFEMRLVNQFSEFSSFR